MWVKKTKSYLKRYSHLELNESMKELLKLFDNDDHRQAQAINSHWDNYLDYLAEPNFTDTAESAEFAALMLIERQIIREAIQQLGDVQKRRIIMYYFDDLTQQTIAEIEGVSQPAIQASIDIALRKIKSFVKNLNLDL